MYGKSASNKKGQTPLRNPTFFTSCLFVCVQYTLAMIASVRCFSPVDVQPPGVIKYLLIRNYGENLRSILP